VGESAAGSLPWRRPRASSGVGGIDDTGRLTVDAQSLVLADVGVHLSLYKGVCAGIRSASPALHARG
jgi:hypothetical protein